MNECIELFYVVDGRDFTSCGQASEDVKRTLKRIGISPVLIRKVAVAMYEGEVNMVIHANGGDASVKIFTDHVDIILKDSGPGISDIPKAMQEGFSTATEDIRALGFGAGMGLPNMKKNSNFLHIDSIVGEGTTVSMRVDL